MTIIASLILNRFLNIFLISIGLIHFLGVKFNLYRWSCPIKHFIGIPSPSCGLSRATVALIHGDWHKALLIHAFSPLVLIIVGLMFISFLLPKIQLIKLSQQIQIFEQKTNFDILILTSLIFYWLIRLLLFPQLFYDLVY